jgi:uncharacterized membrane protein YtjA (UPF0391 family)
LRYTMVPKSLRSLPYGAFDTCPVQIEGIVAQVRQCCHSARFRALFKARKIVKSGSTCQEVTMLRWALAFFIVALVAALLGFTGVAVAAAGIAKILFFIFLILFLVTLVGHLLRPT